MPVGSAQWIHDENDQVAQVCAQEAEDFAFSARNEVEWLNEHMAEIFSKNQVMLRKSSRPQASYEARLLGRQERGILWRPERYICKHLRDLTQLIVSVATDGHILDQCSTNNSPRRKASPVKAVPAFQVAEDPIAPAEVKRLAKANTDSGYHGLSEDDMDLDQLPPVVQSSVGTNDTVEISPASHGAVQVASIGQLEGRSTTETSFHSAKEEMTKRDVISSALQEEASPRADRCLARFYKE